MKIGYARVSTEDQNLDLQLDALKQQGCIKLFQEKMTGKTKSRPVLNKTIKALRPGDMLVVWKLDRLGRSLQDLIEILKLLERNGVGFHSISDGIDTTSSCGRLLFHIIGAIAEFECNQISERTKAGLQAARRRGSKLGRPRSISDEQIALARSLSDDLSLTHIAVQLNVGRTTLWRAMARL
ncbi:MAG: recombinase family protein [Methylotenera sp.]|nr:recombinase family protein [Methylococcaceae bacterium]MDP3818715.1 recombinase family protein [Methylotenera sp.]